MSFLNAICDNFVWYRGFILDIAVLRTMFPFSKERKRFSASSRFNRPLCESSDFVIGYFRFERFSCGDRQYFLHSKTPSLLIHVY